MDLRQRQFAIQQERAARQRWFAAPDAPSTTDPDAQSDWQQQLSRGTTQQQAARRVQELKDERGSAEAALESARLERREAQAAYTQQKSPANRRRLNVAQAASVMLVREVSQSRHQQRQLERAAQAQDATLTAALGALTIDQRSLPSRVPLTARQQVHYRQMYASEPRW
ncbi:hypothetical protein JCM10207_005854 [Rhodosporidiobolus poonsookiae]